MKDLRFHVPAAPPRVRILGEEGAMREMLAAVLSPRFVLDTQDAGVPYEVRVTADAVVCACGEAEVRLPRPLELSALHAAMDALVAAQARAGGYRCDARTRTVALGEKAVLLTETEYALFCALHGAAGTVVSGEALALTLWGKRNDNALRVQVAYLRKKLSAIAGPGAVVAVRGEGYLLKAD